jgi:cyanophycinase-like exopeptidase
MLMSFFTLICLIAQGQGHLMLAGGNGETSGGWSDAPYAWVVEKAANKRIAVISYQSGQSDWLPNYFKSKGAVRARNFYIPDRVTADLQATYDSLITYDGIFLKGGNQFIYYDRYKETKTQQVIQEIYDRGGVLSGTSAGTAILSPIVFTAENVSVDPSQALLNAYTSQMTLEDDFLNTVSERYIFDSHFVERGRFGRLVPFMASWYNDNNEITTGIGVDDRTAFCIDNDNVGYAFGTAAINFIRNLDEEQPFDTDISMPRARNMKLTQLLNGCSIDLTTHEVEGFDFYVDPAVKEENGRYTIFACGTDYPSEDACNHFAMHAGSNAGKIIIITGLSTQRAEDVKSKLEAAGAGDVHIVQALSGKRYNQEMKEHLEEAQKLVVVDNTYEGFFSFVNGGGNGALLKERLTQPGSISFFVGDNARFPGKTVIDRYSGFGYTSYEGTLEFKEGLGMLETTAIMPYAFAGSDTYENTVSGVPYAMIRDALHHGIYLTGNTFMEYSCNNDGESWVGSLYGSFPLILLTNDGTYSGFANQGPNEFSRNVAGFEEMYLQFLAPGDSIVTGTDVPAGIKQLEVAEFIKVYPNPGSDRIHFDIVSGEYQVRISDTAGRICMDMKLPYSRMLDISRLNEGFYIVELTNVTTGSRKPVRYMVSR